MMDGYLEEGAEELRPHAEAIAKAVAELEGRIKAVFSTRGQKMKNFVVLAMPEGGKEEVTAFNSCTCAACAMELALMLMRVMAEEDAEKTEPAPQDDGEAVAAARQVH